MSLVLLAALLAPAPPAETARGFVTRVYAGYRDPGFNPLDRPERHFAPPLVAAIREDARLSRDEVGWLDGDPLCQCQDHEGLDPLVREVRQAGKTAMADIGLRFPGYDERQVRLRLVRTPQGWRIADVATSDDPSLLEDLRRANRRRR
ncbi:MAG TPA: hypothetical protein VF605_18280 [Allosphingosinicella sp.]|jgi:hypothetical protein